MPLYRKKSVLRSISINYGSIICAFTFPSATKRPLEILKIKKKKKKGEKKTEC